jgi:hypothetical protein
MPISNDINMQEMADMGILHMIEKHGGGAGFTSAKYSALLLLHIAFNEFEKSRASVPNEVDGRRNLYFLHQFSEHVQKRAHWLCWLQAVAGTHLDEATPAKGSLRIVLR